MKSFSLTSQSWPLTYDIYLQTWPRYPSTSPTCQNSSLYVCQFGRESGNRQTDTHTDGAKTITPDTSQTWGVRNETTLWMTLFLLKHEKKSLPCVWSFRKKQIKCISGKKYQVRKSRTETSVSILDSNTIWIVRGSRDV